MDGRARPFQDRSHPLDLGTEHLVHAAFDEVDLLDGMVAVLKNGSAIKRNGCRKGRSRKGSARPARRRFWTRTVCSRSARLNEVSSIIPWRCSRGTSLSDASSRKATPSPIWGHWYPTIRGRSAKAPPTPAGGRSGSSEPALVHLLPGTFCEPELPFAGTHLDDSTLSHLFGWR